jgi:hypothetical protein
MRYREWNARICEHFFNSSNMGRSVLLQVDPEELAVLGGFDSEDEARADFTAALVDSVEGDGSLEQFDFRRQIEPWDRLFRKKQPPPFVALLAASVLAAHDMASDARTGVSSSNYYRPLQKIIGIDLTQTGRSRLSTYWQCLNRWLDSDWEGKRGQSSAFQFQNFPNIGYPLSQCTLRREDRRRLSDFFRWCRLSPSEVVDEEQLAKDFREWLSLPKCTFSNRTKELLNLVIAGGISDSVTHDLAHEYELWDGSIRERGGGRVAPVELQCKFIYPHRRITLQFVPQCPAGFPGGSFSLSDGGAYLNVDVTQGDSGFYQPLPLPVTGSRLRQGLQLKQGSYGLHFRGRTVVVLEQDSDIGDYVTRDQTTLGEPTVVLCHESVAQLVEQTLSKQASQGWHVLSAGSSGIPQGWTGYCCVDFPKLFVASPGAEPLEPRRRFDVHLEGGLKFASDCWMTGRLPAVVIRSEDLQPVSIALDEKSLGSFPVPFRLDLNDKELRPAVHRLVVSGRLISFRVADSAPPDAKKARALIGWAVKEGPTPMTGSSAGQIEWSNPVLSGCTFSEPAKKIALSHHVALYPGGGEVAWLGPQPGQLEPVPQRQLLSRVGQSSLELAPPSGFGPSWIWYRESQREFIAAFETHPPPPPGRHDSDDNSDRIEQWALMLASSRRVDLRCTTACRESCKEMLIQYKQLARSILADR